MKIPVECVSFAFFLALMTPGVAGTAQITADQKAVTKVAAKLLYGESRCPQFEANTPALAVVASSYKVSMDDWRKEGRLRQLLEANIQLMRAEFDSTADKVFCQSLETAYGSRGAVIPGAMKRR